MHCQKNPWKFPHWGNIFKSFTFSFALYFTPRSSPPLAHSHLSLQSTISPRCSYKFKDTETAVPVIWQIYKQRKTLNFSFIVTKTHARTRKKERKKKITRKQLEVNCFFLNRKALFWNIRYFNPRVQVIKSSVFFLFYVGYDSRQGKSIQAWW